MVPKKRTRIRDKVAKHSKLPNDDIPTPLIDLPPDPNAFLHTSKETKKEKLLNKSISFLNKIKRDNCSSISKSSLRRRKRNARDELKPKMQDLLVSLEHDGILTNPTVKENNIQETQHSITRIVENPKKLSSVGSNIFPIKKNEPNIRNQKGAKVLVSKEAIRFNHILTNKSFQQNPFAALREVIEMRK